jgi:hypothetical protein
MSFNALARGRKLKGSEVHRHGLAQSAQAGAGGGGDRRCYELASRVVLSEPGSGWTLIHGHLHAKVPSVPYSQAVVRRSRNGIVMADESADNQAAEKLVEALTGNISATQAELLDMSNGLTQFHAQMVKLTANDRCPLWE